MAELVTLDAVATVELVAVGRLAVELVVALVVASREVLVTVVVHGQLVLGVVPGLLQLLAGRLLDVLAHPELRQPGPQPHEPHLGVHALSEDRQAFGSPIL